MKVKNKLNTLATAPGLDYIFEPGEVKEVTNPKELEFISKCPEIFEILSEEKKEGTVTPENPESSFVCQTCGFKAKSQFGLETHKRKKNH